MHELYTKQNVSSALSSGALHVTPPLPLLVCKVSFWQICERLCASRMSLPGRQIAFFAPAASFCTLADETVPLCQNS